KSLKNKKKNMDEIIEKVLEEYSRLKAWEEEYGNDEIDEDEYL
ncbi:unnamed protein product, partial [Brachionus calyciflorus]